MPTLLAIDLGLRTGMAVYQETGRLASYASRNFGTRTRLKSAIPGVVSALPDLAFVVVEGERALGEWWARAAQRLGAQTIFVPPEVWRPRLLLPRERRSGVDAKHFADRLSRQVIAWSGAKTPTSLKHDAAEAILIGLWGVLEVGWLERLPRDLRVAGL